LLGLVCFVRALEQLKALLNLWREVFRAVKIWADLSLPRIGHLFGCLPGGIDHAGSNGLIRKLFGKHEVLSESLLGEVVYIALYVLDSA